MYTLLFYCLLLLDAFLPQTGGQICFARPDLESLGKIVKGRVLLLVVKEGMTEGEVKQLFGRPDGEFWYGGGSVIEVSYGQYGLNVWYKWSESERKVTDVTVYHLVTSLER
jgi:hypothetical protein